jgi:hypothetical protein
MTEPNTTPNAEPDAQRSPLQLAVVEAGRITGDMVNNLQKISKTFLLIGQLLTEVRDRKYYETLHHPDMADYALKRLDLGKAAMYRYMQVYEWARAKHPEWLDPDQKVRIPQLTQVAGLMWTDQELAKEGLRPERKASLQALEEKAKAGKLPSKELRAAQQRTNKLKPSKGTAKMLASLRAMRKRGERDGVSAGLLAALDNAIRVAENDLEVETAGLHYLDNWPSDCGPQSCLDHNSMIT